MYSVNQEITDLKGEFEGGKSFTLDWYAKLRQGANMVLDNANPETLKRVVPIYGGLTRHLQVYYCPADVEVPSRLYSRDKNLRFDHVAPAYFYAHPEKKNVFCIEYVNGIRFIVVRHPMSVTSATLDEMNTATGALGDVTLTANTFNLLPGASASLQGTFTDSVYKVKRTLATAIDISALLYGVAIAPIFLDSEEKLSSVKLLIKTSDTAYYEIQSSQDSVGDYIRDGQNMVRFAMQSATQTGSPDPTNITAYELQIQMASGKSQTVVLGKLTIQAAQMFNFEYYSTYMFVDGVTGAWKDTPVSGDLINLNRDVLGILHFETCRLVVQGQTTDRINSAESQRIDQNLARKYAGYYNRHPSSEQPISYDISPEIALSSDPFFEYDINGLPEEMGESENALQPQYNVNFADAEVPAGTFDGSNQTFTLLHVPTPSASLEVVINGEVLVLGLGYTLAANVLTLLSPYYTAPFIGLPFYVNYRYSV